MKLKRYIELLNKLMENPANAEYDVIVSKDDEGNGFNHIHYEPGVGHFDGEDFMTLAEIQEYLIEEGEQLTTNVVLVN
jgi:hypothetical protein